MSSLLTAAPGTSTEVETVWEGLASFGQGRRWGRQDCCETHRRVMSLWPDTDSTTPRAHWGVLWREIEGGMIRIRAGTKPSEERGRGGFHLVGECRTVGPDIIRDGSLVRFGLVGNMTRRKSVRGLGECSRGPREVLEEDECPVWVTRKLGESGLEVVDMAFGHLGAMIGIRGHAMVTVSGREVVGTARVSDERAAWAAYSDGIGRGRSYGLGLLEIRAE
ncbi:MAG: type I-E CRISPR-associated protein Cas6/Cse3/CasE [Acidimicrobiales bacterium]